MDKEGWVEGGILLGGGLRSGYLGTPKKKVGCTTRNVSPSEPCDEIITATVKLAY